MSMEPLRALKVAGSAAGVSVGIQAELQTFHEIDGYGMAIVTALGARHPETGVNVHKQTLEAIEAQFSTALNQVKKFDGMKTGMLFSKEIIEKVTEMINFYQIDRVVV